MAGSPYARKPRGLFHLPTSPEYRFVTKQDDSGDRAAYARPVSSRLASRWGRRSTATDLATAVYDDVMDTEHKYIWPKREVLFAGQDMHARLLADAITAIMKSVVIFFNS